MNDQARKLLAFVIHHYGVDVIQTPKQLQALLKDHAKGQFKPEISLFMQAVTEGLVVKLLTHQYSSVQVLSARAIKHLQQDCFIEEQAAHWVIDSWCIALKLARPIPIHITPAPVAQVKPLPVTVATSPVPPPTLVALSMPTVQVILSLVTQGASVLYKIIRILFKIMGGLFLLFLVIGVLSAIFGEGKQDKAPAIASTPKAAKQGSHNLEVMKTNTESVAKDNTKTEDKLRKDAEQGDAEAQYNLGVRYAEGRGVAQNDAQAVIWFRKAAEQGLAEAQFSLGFMYENDIGVAKDEAQAVTWYRKAAEQGYALAQFNLGLMYVKGRGVAKDDAQAVIWYRKAAEQGDAEAQYNLGVRYAEGLGVAKDDAQAVTWTRKAAEQGEAKAQFNLGVRYAEGLGVATDKAQAVTWFRKAAEQGLAKAQFNLGVRYAEGRGVAKDDAQAVTWFRKAAEQGLAKAQFALGLMYAKGLGVIKDDAQAATWFRKAAEQGLAKAQFALGLMYEYGQGVAKDEAQAVTWFRKAAEQGDAEAQRQLEKIKNQVPQTTQTTESLAQEPSQAQITSQPATQTQGVWTTDWGNDIIGSVTTETCHVAELTNQGYVYAISSSIPLARLKQNADAWQIIGDRAITVLGCWFKKDANNTGLIHAKFKRKKDDKTWEDDLNLADSSWTFKRID
jgi:TPR repeat protein